MALETREAMGALTEKWRELGHDVGFGIDIEHGYATLGTIGFEGLFDYAAIGTVSNVRTDPQVLGTVVYVRMNSDVELLATTVLIGFNQRWRPHLTLHGLTG